MQRKKHEKMTNKSPCKVFESLLSLRKNYHKRIESHDKWLRYAVNVASSPRNRFMEER